MLLNVAPPPRRRERQQPPARAPAPHFLLPILRCGRSSRRDARAAPSSTSAALRCATRRPRSAPARLSARAARCRRHRHSFSTTRNRRRRGRARNRTAFSCFRLIEPSLRPRRVVALRELGENALVVELRLPFSSHRLERRGEIVERSRAIAVLRIRIDPVVDTLRRSSLTL